MEMNFWCGGSRQELSGLGKTRGNCSSIRQTQRECVVLVKDKQCEGRPDTGMGAGISGLCYIETGGRDTWIDTSIAR